MAALATSVTHMASSMPASIRPNSTQRGLQPNMRKMTSAMRRPRCVFWKAALSSRTPRKNAKVLSPKPVETTCPKSIRPVKGSSTSTASAVTAIGASIKHQLKIAKTSKASAA